ncbi:MAG: type II toxin-antitoxin system VapC family toxin [Chloroflexi bacterium]|nr:type II toxin-antitoxin system VapC family toxin [Chloroflexota bacterium]
MIVVDTAVWIDHLRGAETRLSPLLHDNQVLVHPMVVGELACGHLRNRAEVLRLLGELPPAPVADDQEVLAFIEHHRLMGCGIGYIDAHLLAATAIAASAHLWTIDQRLMKVAVDLGLSKYRPD